ncbi:MAG: TA system VapC family ribonuclease toxin [Accumulibacter sp.]
MSFGIDVNILLYASDRSSPWHEKASAFLQRCAAGSEVFCIAWVTALSYLRMATHGSIFAQPLSADEAAGNVEALLALPHCRALGEDEGFWAVYRQVTRAFPVRGNLVPDAHLAAVLRQHGVVTLYTHDRDFRKFDFLRAIDPLV